MISILATTAFFTAVTADSNLTWLPLFDLKPQTLDTPQPELKEAGYETCFDVTEKGIGYNLELAKFCKEVTDYELQCAGEDLEGLPTATATKKETEEVEGDRRLEVEEEKEEAEKEEVEGSEAEAKVATTTISPEELAELEKTWEAEKAQVYDENIKAYGALASCIQRSRYYSSSWWNTSWLKAKYAKLTCKEVIDQFGDGSCDSENSKKYALNVCCPKTCNTSEKLGCEAEEQSSKEDAIKEAIKENETGAGKLGEVCEGHSDCGANLQCGSESRPATPAPTTTEEPTTTTEAPNAAETVDETASTEASASEAVRLLDAAETEKDAAETEKDAAETEEDAAETVDETVDETVKTETEEVETVETAQKKCQKAGASYYGFGFLAALLAVVSL